MSKRPKSRSYEQKKRRVAYWFLLPWMIGTVFFFFRPMIESVMYSLGTFSITDEGYSVTVTGFSYYIEIFTGDADYIRNIMDSFKNMLLTVPTIVMLSLFFAILLDRKFRGRTFFRALFFLPVLVGSGALLSMIGGDVVADNMISAGSVSHLFQSSFLQSVLRESGVAESVVSSLTALVDSVFSLLWKSGIQILIFLAGLSGIPDSLYEVASIEGATKWECFWKVTFPMLSSTLLIGLIYTIVDSFTDNADPVMAQIDTLSKQMFIEESQAMAWSYFGLVLIVIVAVYLLVDRHVFYNN